MVETDLGWFGPVWGGLTVWGGVTWFEVVQGSLRGFEMVWDVFG